MEVINSNKGNGKIIYAGYMYVVHRENSDDIRWRYSKNSSLKCAGSLSTDLNKQNPVIKTGHNHPRDKEECNVTRSIAEIKNRACDTLAQPAQIFAQTMHKLPNSTRARMSAESSVKRTLQNKRKKHGPNNVRTLEELVIEGEWTLTGGAESVRFLLYDNGTEADERIIIFATDEILELLQEAEEWFLDRNISLAPKLFLQLYVLRVEVKGIYITIAYCLLERKTRNTYTEVFKMIIDECNTREIFPDPRIIHMDFERAVIDSVREVFGEDVQIQGCFYHLTQSTFRKVQSLQLQTQYMTDEALNEFCGMIDGLAFLPIDDVSEGITYLHEVCPPAAEQLLKYFDETYVTGSERQVGPPEKTGTRSKKTRKIAPIFPPNLWNVHETTIKGGARTNNRVEGWNNRFSHIVGYNHPSTWLLIQKIREEVACDSTRLEQRHLGNVETQKKRPGYVKRQKCLLQLCVDYSDGILSVGDFLKRVSNNIRFISH